MTNDTRPDRYRITYSVCIVARWWPSGGYTGKLFCVRQQLALSGSFTVALHLTDVLTTLCPLSSSLYSSWPLHLYVGISHGSDLNGQGAHFLLVPQVNIVTYTGYVCGSVTSNNTWVRIGYRIYSLWRFTAAHITITMNTIALIASRVPLTELHCADE
jgi:hypothetical protein